MAIDRLINSDQGTQIITKLQDIATQIDNYSRGSLPTHGMGYATCDTATATDAKTVTLTGYALTEGSTISIKFTNDVNANATLNINSTGAKPIYYNGSAITANIISAGDIATFIYSNNYYYLINIDRIINDVAENKTNISSLSGHFTFSANSGHYYLQPEQPSNPQDGDIWIG